MGAPLYSPHQSFLNYSSGRKQNPDGSVDIKCRLCGKTVCRAPYMGFSTVTCIICQGLADAGKTPEEIMALTKEKEFNEAAAVYEDIGRDGFKASGFKQKLKDVIEAIKQTSSRRKRSPLFAKKDKV